MPEGGALDGATLRCNSTTQVLRAPDVVSEDTRWYLRERWGGHEGAIMKLGAIHSAAVRAVVRRNVVAERA